MSQFYDQASLVMIPSGYKNGKVYSQKPLSTDGELTFSRGSDIEATRVNANGYIEKAKVNLLLQSNTFSTTWANFNTTETGGQSGYDGSNDAWLLQNTAASGSIRQTISSSGVQTYSFYAKAGTTDWVAAYVATGGSIPYCFFDLTNGVKGATQNNVIDSSITAVGGGWYRIALAFNTTTTDVRIFPAEANAVLASQVGDNIYIQDAQINYGLVAQEYQETTTTSVVSGITNDMPRLDYSGGASCPSLLLEPSRTNLVTQSEYIGVWSQNDLVGTDNFAVSPEGVQNAAKISASLTSATHFIQLTGASVGSDATISVFAKADTGSYIQLTNPYSGANFANFDVVTGVVGTKGTNCTSSSIEDYGNGWYRCTAVFNYVGTSHTYRHHIVSSASAPFGESWLPSSDTSLFVYGHQWEAGSYPTSYIPTYGTSATRTADACNKTGISSLIGQASGTLYWEGKIIQLGDEGRISLSDGSADDRLWIRLLTNGEITWNVYNGGTEQAAISSLSAYSVGDTIKVAATYAANDFKLYINGVEQGTDTSGSVSGWTLDKLDYGRYNGLNPMLQLTKQIIVFPTALSATDLATLTA